MIAILLLGISLATHAEGKWEICRKDDFERNDEIEGDLRDVLFVDKDNGWAVGGEGLILRTADGGSTWNKLDCPMERPMMFSSIHLLNPKVAMIAGMGSTVFGTKDAGKTWVEHKVAREGRRRRKRLTDIFMVSEKIAYASGGDNTLLKTADGGLTWNPLIGGRGARVGETRNNFDGLYFVTPEIGWVAGSFGTILRTAEGGENWEQQKEFFKIVGNESKKINLSNDLSTVHFVSKTEGWVVGQEGVILHTADGGKKWEKQKSGVEDALNSIIFLDNKVGWACGDFGTIVHTVDGGKTWKHEKIGSSKLLGITAVKPNYCWAVGEWGIIIRLKAE